MLQRSVSALWIMSLLAIAACNNETPVTEAAQPTLDNLIPKPVMVKAEAGSFSLSDSTIIIVAPGNPDLLRIAGYIADVLKPAMGFTLQIDSVARTSNSIALGLVNDSSLTRGGI